MKKRLDYIIIPYSGGEIQKIRNQKVAEERKKRQISKKIILKGKDSEEDVLILGKKLKNGDKIGIVTFPLHFKEYKELIKKAKKYNKFPKKVDLKNIKIPEDLHLKVYGEFGYLEEKFKHRKLDYLKNRHEKILNFLKNIFHKIVRL